MERFENLLDFINELNENGRIPYDDYSRLFDLVQEFAGAEEAINAAATDIAALLWLNGNCEYCEHGEKSFFSIAILFLPVAPIGQPVMQLQLGVVVFQCDLDDDFFAPHGNIGDFGFQHSRHRLRRDLV